MALSTQYPWVTLGTVLLLTISGTNADEPPDEEAKMFLDTQNTFRDCKHKLPPLHWDNKLAECAKAYACKRQKDCELEHSDTCYGENIFQGCGDQWTPADAVKAWADDEMKFYDPIKNECCGGGECGHYTQVVWRNTTKVGCARVVCDNKKGIFMICNYDPPGNYIGQKPF